MNDNKFRFFVPCDLEKASNTEGVEVMRVKGIASTANKDSQDEALDPSGMDLKDFKWINYNHHGSKDPATIIGEPTKAEVTKDNELYIEGILYPEVPMAKTVFSLMKALKNSPSGNKLCLSVEGKVTKRGSDDKNHPLYGKILKSKITGVAICPVPVNGDTWVDFIQKGYTNDNDSTYDDETTTAINHANDEDNSGTIVVLRKSEIFEKIYDKFPEITIEKAKSVYSLIEKTTNAMNKGDNTVSKETIEKAFEILELATSTTGVIKKGETSEKPEEDEDDEDEKEMVAKANGIYKAMCSESKDDESIKATLVKKGYGEKVITKAMSKDASVKNDGLTKSEVSDLIKSHTDSITKAFDDKMTAVGVVLKNSLEENGDLQKSLEDSLAKNAEMTAKNEELVSKMDSFLKTSVGSKSMISKSYSDKFGSDESAGGKASLKYNINNVNDRIALKERLTEMSGIRKGENYDQRLVGFAQEIEMVKDLTDQSINLLKAMDIEVLRA